MAWNTRYQEDNYAYQAIGVCSVIVMVPSTSIADAWEENGENHI